jgi:hypothetical protein
MPTNAAASAVVNGAAPAGPGSKAATFCGDYIHLAGGLAGLTYYFLIAALVLGIAYGVVELIKKYQAAPPPQKAAAGAIKDLIDSLRAFLEALAKAPAWLGLFGVGVILFWVVAAAVPGECNNAFNDPYPASSAGGK